MKKMIYIIKWGGLYQNKGNPGLVFTCNCKMRYYMVFKCIYVLVPPYTYLEKCQSRRQVHRYNTRQSSKLSGPFGCIKRAQTELSGVQFGLKSYACFRSRTCGKA